MVPPLIYWVPVEKKAREETPKSGGAKSDTEMFGPLKVVLRNIPEVCINDTVRSCPPAHTRHFTQLPGNFRSGEQGLKPPLTYSCIGGLFQFASEQRARAETPSRFDTVRGPYSSFTPRAHFLLASSMAWRNNCGCFLRSRGCFCLLMASKPVKIHFGFSKISKRRSSTIRFVHDLTFFSLLMGTADGATGNIRQPRFKGNSKCSYFRLSKRNNLSSQDPGWIIFCLRVLMTITS